MTEMEKELCDALVPFVKAFHKQRIKARKMSASRGAWFDKMPDKFHLQVILTMGDFRRAGQALQEIAKSEQ